MGRGNEYGAYDLYEWRDRHKYVCFYCIPNKFLKNLILWNEAQKRCSFCRHEQVDVAATPVSVLMESIISAFQRHFSDPINAGFSNDSEAQGSVCTISSFDALTQLFQKDEDCCGSLVVEYIADGFENKQWVEAAEGIWMGEHEHEALVWSW